MASSRCIASPSRQRPLTRPINAASPPVLLITSTNSMTTHTLAPPSGAARAFPWPSLRTRRRPMSHPDPPALVVHGDVATLMFPTDDYAFDFRQVSLSKYGNL